MNVEYWRNKCLGYEARIVSLENEIATLTAAKGVAEDRALKLAKTLDEEIPVKKATKKVVKKAASTK